MKAFWVCLSAFLLVAGRASAETTTICDLKVDYAPTAPAADLAPELRALAGQWVGRQAYTPIYQRCVGLVVERIEANGTVHAKFAFSHAGGQGFSNSTNFGTNSIKATYQGGVLKYVAPTVGFEVRLVAPNEFQGTWKNSAGTYPIWFKRE